MGIQNISQICSLCIEDKEVAVQSVPVMIHRLSLNISDDEEELIISTFETCVEEHGNVFFNSCRDIRTIIKALPHEKQKRIRKSMPEDIHIDPLQQEMK